MMRDWKTTEGMRDKNNRDNRDTGSVYRWVIESRWAIKSTLSSIGNHSFSFCLQCWSTVYESRSDSIHQNRKQSILDDSWYFVVSTLICLNETLYPFPALFVCPENEFTLGSKGFQWFCFSASKTNFQVLKQKVNSNLNLIRFSVKSKVARRIREVLDGSVLNPGWILFLRTRSNISDGILKSVWSYVSLYVSYINNTLPSIDFSVNVFDALVRCRTNQSFSF